MSRGCWDGAMPDWVRAALAALALALLGGCDKPKPDAPPAVLRFGAIPDQRPENVRAQHEGVVGEACAASGLRCELLAAATYEEVVDRLGRGELDIAFLGGVTYARARLRHGVEPLVMREVDRSFSSVVVVRLDDPARALADLNGRRFAFGNRSSTSGHHMARKRLAAAGFVPERDARGVVYAGSHDESMRRTHAGEVDAAVVNAEVYLRAQLRGESVARGLRVVWQSAPYADYVWVARGGLPAELRRRLRDGFLNLTLAQPAHREALESAGARGFLPAFPEDFEEVLATVQAQENLP